ncbi:MAG: putative zinc-binding peptidase [Verrucomicrobiota bacterium]|nr:putative zinc-binding peptidase [Verrucomicrobiota bacterium]
MKNFHCDECGNLVFFENVLCVRCNHTLGFIPDALDLTTVDPEGSLWRPLAEHSRERLYRLCANSVQHHICNWLVPQHDPDPLCKACRLNEVVPDLSVPGNQERWLKLEIAKRRTIYTILRLKLPTEADEKNKKPPLRFHFKADAPGAPVMTGHANGIITINTAEADDDERERRRVALNEPFRTLLGHLRHEIAHYYWERLISNTPHLVQYRELFGDETTDYSDALKLYYTQGAAADWQNRCVTPYASSHPWEDWAEAFAHYLHILDTTETAASFGISLRPRHPNAPVMTADLKKINPLQSDFDSLYENWLPLTYALNELNRGMGLPDLYPFVISTPVIAKLRFIHDVLHEFDSASHRTQ